LGNFLCSQDENTAHTAPTPAWQMLEKLPLLRTSVLIALIMLLKSHLKNLYGLTEEYGVLSCSRFYDGFLTGKYRKCLKWVMGKKNALGDKPATRRAGAAAAPLTWARLPFATQPLLTTADMAAQRDTVCHISFVMTGVYSFIINYTSSWKFGTRTGSLPSQKMT
jgi:cohesin loading factor subunit SCC2